MTASAPVKRLGKALRVVTDNGNPGKVVALAREWGIEGRAARRAAQDIDVNASGYLKLCAAIGIDPVDGKSRDSTHLEEIDWNRVAIKVLMHLIASGKGMRKVAKSWGLSTAAIVRAKTEQPINTENFLKLCKALKAHPHEFTKQVPEKFHGEQSVKQVEHA